MESRELITVYNEFKSTGFEIIGIAMDDDRQTWIMQ